MDVRYSPDCEGFQFMTTDELRETFLIDNLFQKNKIPMTYSDIDRSITGSAVPSGKSLKLTASKKEMAAKYFTERREIGVINIGGKGSIKVGSKEFKMDRKDALYIGRGKHNIEFSSDKANQPAMFYFVSYPAHTKHPSKQIKFAKSTPVRLGSDKAANKRTIYKYIHPGTMPTCQLVMGLTELEEGSVWNTMPAHTHQRRSEVYMYFNIDKNSIVIHIFGEPTETRHMIIRDKQAALSPSWSMHAGCGTQNYSFIWAMGGENQDFDDMDAIPMTELK
ncbi:4-deoxy-l-threo-5-hexosulose-uronate ketol-isomerase [hydrocarbon metagenome]|uniref:5-dehydro-4-deoxy-D-glucuronate isomerase n=1 Tax=hydrocarbon metagenome TaxID=938273 RepID=A0A0W8FXC1_9ZZZZ